MRLFCRLCGARTDGRERLGIYCPGNHCGSDLSHGAMAGVQAWCEPEWQRGSAGRAVTVRLLVRNAGPRPDTYRVEPVEQVDGRLDFDAAPLNVPLAPGESRTVEIRYTLPRDRVGLGLDVASRFGVPGADAAGQINDGRSDRFGVALRVVSTTANQGAACAAFAVDVPGRFRRDNDDNAPRARRRSTPMVVGSVLVALIIAVAAVIAVAADKDDDGSKASAQGDSSQALPIDVSSPGSTVGGGTDDKTGTDGGSVSGSGTGQGGGSVGGKNGGTVNGRADTGGGKGSPGPTTPGPTPVPKAEDAVVPDTAELTTQEAKDKVTKAGLVPTIEAVPNTRGPQGTVLKSEPAAGTMVAGGSTVVVYVRDGKTVVPDVSGMSQDDARAALTKAGLASKFTTVATSNTKLYDKAVRTDPTPGTSVGVLTGVTVYMGKPDIR